MIFYLRNNKEHKIKVGDVLTLQDYDEENCFEDKVTSIYNPKTEDVCFQIRTESLDYDFTNFFFILKINQIEIDHRIE